MARPTRQKQESSTLDSNRENENDDTTTDDSEIDNDHEEDVESSQTHVTTSLLPPAISKSWSRLTSHSPCYTGGTVHFSHSASTWNSVSQFVLAQRGGDVAIVDARSGLLLRTVRKGVSVFESGAAGTLDDLDGGAEEDDQENETFMDGEAITAFALSPNDRDIVVVTRAHLVQRYSLGMDAPSLLNKTSSQNSIADKNPATLSLSFGKSGHVLPVTIMDFHPSGAFFATGSVDGLVKVWDCRNGYATHAFYPNAENRESTTAFERTGRGRYAVTCLQWRPITSSLILAVGREDGSVAIYDLLIHAQGTKKALLPVAILKDHLSAVTCVAWSDGISDAKNTSSAGNKGDSVENNLSHSSSRQLKHGGGLFFTAGKDSVINSWLISEEEMKEPPRNKKKKTHRTDSQPKVHPIQIIYTRVRTLPVYEEVAGMIVLPRKFRPTSITKERRQVLDRKDVVLITCGTKGVVRMWRATPTGNHGVEAISDFSLVASIEEEDAVGEETGGYTSLHLTTSSDSADPRPRLVAVDAEHNMTYLSMEWKKDEDATLSFIVERVIVGDNGEVLDLAVIPPRQMPSSKDIEIRDKHTIAVATNSSQIRIFGLGETEINEDKDGNDNTRIRSHPALYPRGILVGHTAIVLAIDASPCGRYLVTAGKDKSLRLWHIATQKCIRVGIGHTEAIGCVALSNKIGLYDVGGKSAENGAGAFIVTASKDKTLKVWPLPGSAVLNRTSGEGDDCKLSARLSARAHDKDINIVSIAPNDSLIATGSQDKLVKLWRTTDLSLHGTLKGHKRGVWDCQFSPIDRVLASASGDRTLKLWSIVDCTCVRTFQGHMAGVLRVRFLITGLQLISSGSDGLIKLWTIRTNECENTIDASADKIWALDLSPCGTALFSGGADSKISVWYDTTKEKDAAVREAEEQNIMMEQKLSNHLRHKEYEQALEIAIALDKPNQVLKVLTEIIETDTRNNRGVERLQKHTVNWSVKQLTQILKYCREWNTRARNSHIAMIVLKAVFTTISAVKLMSYDEVPEIISGILPYAERHFERHDLLVGNSYLLDFTLFSMGNLHGSNNEEYSEWVSQSKFVLPPKVDDGKIQIGGSLIVGARKKVSNDDEDSSDGSVMTIGDSDTTEDDSGSDGS